MLKGIHPKTFLDTPGEWHAFVIGFFEVLCPWPPRTWAAGTALNLLLGEYPYYMTGRGLGFLTLVVILTALAKFILEVVL